MTRIADAAAHPIIGRVLLSAAAIVGALSIVFHVMGG